MSGFLKITRPDKVTKIYKDLQKAIEAKKMEESVAKLTVELLSLQAEQDPAVVEERLNAMSSLSEKIESQIGDHTVIALYLRQFQIAQVFG